VPPARVQESLAGIADVVPQKEPIGHLQGLRRGLSAGQGRGIGASADEDGHFGRREPPRGQGLGRASFEDRHGPAAFAIDHQGPRGLAAPQRKLIDTDHARRTGAAWLGSLLPDEGVRAAKVTKPACEPRSHLRTAGMGQFQ
jgi:hypothetical protein